MLRSRLERVYCHDIFSNWCNRKLWLCCFRWIKTLVPQEDIFALARSEEKAATLRDKVFRLELQLWWSWVIREGFFRIDRLLFVQVVKLDHVRHNTNMLLMLLKMQVYHTLPIRVLTRLIHQRAHGWRTCYTEEAILASGIAHTFLRNNWYIEMICQLFKQHEDW